jgi:16S rRNA processing protein RimM
MMADPLGKKAGIITKPYGLQGKLNVILDPGAGENIQVGNPLFISIDGQRVPFFIEEVEQISPDHCIIKFEFIEGVEEARKVCSCEVFHDPMKQAGSVEDQTIFDHLIGYKAFDLKAGQVGTISGYIPQELNPVFLIDCKGSEMMIPANEELIDHIDRTTLSVYFRLPNGLIDL